MARSALALVAGVLLLAAAGACRRGDKVVMEVSPAEAAPGESAVVRVPGLEAETKADALTVEVGGRPAAVLRVEHPTGVEFLVPEREPGPTEVAVRVAGRDVGRVAFTVLAPPARQLVLSMAEGAVQLISSRGAASLDRPSRELAVRGALAYDVVTADGRLVATGTVPHPLAGRRELFEPEGTMRGAPAPKSATFTLRIPAVPKGSKVRFYEIEPGKDLATAEGRAARRLLSEVEVGG